VPVRQRPPPPPAGSASLANAADSVRALSSSGCLSADAGLLRHFVLQTGAMRSDFVAREWEVCDAPPPERVDLRSVLSSFQPLGPTPGPILFVACDSDKGLAVAFTDGALCVLQRASNEGSWDAYRKHLREATVVRLPNADGTDGITIKVFVWRAVVKAGGAGAPGAPAKATKSGLLELALTGRAAAAQRAAASPARVRAAPGRSDVTSAPVNRFSPVLLRAGAAGDALREARYLRDVLTGMPKGSPVALSRGDRKILTPQVDPAWASEPRQSAAEGVSAAAHAPPGVGTDADVLEGDGPVLLSAVLRWVLGSPVEDRRGFLLDDVRDHPVDRLIRMTRFLTW